MARRKGEPPPERRPDVRAIGVQRYFMTLTGVAIEPYALDSENGLGLRVISLEGNTVTRVRVHFDEDGFVIMSELYHDGSVHELCRWEVPHGAT